MLNCIMNKLLTKNEGVYQMGLVSEYGVMMGKFAFKKFTTYFFYYLISYIMLVFKI